MLTRTHIKVQITLYSIILILLAAMTIQIIDVQEENTPNLLAAPDSLLKFTVNDGFPQKVWDLVIVGNNGRIMTVLAGDTILIHTDSGNVTISFVDGSVTYDSSVNINEAAELFWKAIIIMEESVR